MNAMTHAETYCHVRGDIHIELGREIRFLKTLVHRLESVWGSSMPDTELPPLIHEMDGQFVPVSALRPPPIPQTNLLAGRLAGDRRGAWPQSAPATRMNPLPPGPVGASGYNFGAAPPQDRPIGKAATLQAQMAAFHAQAQANVANTMPPATNQIGRLERQGQASQGDAVNLREDPDALVQRLLMAVETHIEQKAPVPPNAFHHGGRGHEQRGGESSANTFPSNSTPRSFGSHSSHEQAARERGDTVESPTSPAEEPHAFEFVVSVKNTFLELEKPKAAGDEDPEQELHLLPALDCIPDSVSADKLAAYRMQYARFRVGNANGAKGELDTVSEETR